QVDIDASAIGRRARVDLGVVGDVRQTIAALLPRLKGERDDGYLNACTAHYREARKGLDDLATGKPGGTLHPQHVARSISRLASERAIFTCDVGLPTVWAARYLAMN